MDKSQGSSGIVKIDSLILNLRGQRVILDADLATLYGVETKALNQAVKRNAERFPEDFLFQLSREEKDEVVTKCDHLQKLKFSPVLPYAFTEHGAIMAANLLNSPKAVQMSVFVVRAFVKLREKAVHDKFFGDKLADMERKLSGRLNVHEKALLHIFAEIRKLTGGSQSVSKTPERRIGFHADKEEGSPKSRGERKSG